PKVGEALLRIAPTLEPNVIVASGDFTQRAKREQFQEARAFLDRLPDVPLIVTPGNHDVALYRVKERLFNPYDLYREIIHRELDYVERIEGAVIVSLNSVAPRQAIINGRIDSHQLDFCTEAFRDVPEDHVRIIVSHHHFAPAPDYEGGQVMPKAKRAMNRFLDLDVELILGGHLHRAYVGNSLDIYPGKHRERGIIIVQCGTTTSRRGRVREREKNSFNMVWIDQRMIRITHYMYFEEDDGFAPISRHLFPRHGHRFVEGTAIHH
ncbi:MAG: metallophosphoesterase, partial [Planctomycetes bacterium]|nr:metallophosphoesterase [Planctomycetota bacterium]